MPKPRPSKRYIVRWDDVKNQRLLLCIQYGCNLRGIRLPWEAITPVMDPNMSEGAVTQHLAKMRSRLLAQGHDVPPPLRRGGMTAGGPAPQPSPAPRNTPMAVTTAREPAAQNPRAETGADDVESDDEYQPNPKKAKGPTGRRGGTRRRANIQESRDDDSVPRASHKTEEVVGEKRKRAIKKREMSEDEDEESEAESAEETTKPKIEEESGDDEDEDEDVDMEVDGENSKTMVAANASYMKFLESEDDEKDSDSVDQPESPHMVVTLRVPQGYQSARFPSGLGQFDAGAAQPDVQRFGGDEVDLEADKVGGQAELLLPAPNNGQLVLPAQAEAVPFQPNMGYHGMELDDLPQQSPMNLFGPPSPLFNQLQGDVVAGQHQGFQPMQYPYTGAPAVLAYGDAFGYLDHQQYHQPFPNHSNANLIGVPHSQGPAQWGGQRQQADLGIADMINDDASVSMPQSSNTAMESVITTMGDDGRPDLGGLRLSQEQMDNIRDVAGFGMPGSVSLENDQSQPAAISSYEDFLNDDEFGISGNDF